MSVRNESKKESTVCKIVSSACMWVLYQIGLLFTEPDVLSQCFAKHWYKGGDNAEFAYRFSAVIVSWSTVANSTHARYGRLA